MRRTRLPHSHAREVRADVGSERCLADAAFQVRYGQDFGCRRMFAVVVRLMDRCREPDAATLARTLSRDFPCNRIRRLAPAPQEAPT